MSNRMVVIPLVEDSTHGNHNGSHEMDGNHRIGGRRTISGFCPRFRSLARPPQPVPVVTVSTEFAPQRSQS